MNDWSDYAAAKLKTQAENQRLKDQALVEKQRIKRASGIPLWNEVKRIVKENTEHLNAKMGKQLLVFEVTPNTEISVRSGNRDLQAMFDEATGTLAWKCDRKGDSWQLAVDDDGTVMFRWGMIPTNPGSMAKQMLDALLFD